MLKHNIALMALGRKKYLRKLGDLYDVKVHANPIYRIIVNDKLRYKPKNPINPKRWDRISGRHRSENEPLTSASCC